MHDLNSNLDDAVCSIDRTEENTEAEPRVTKNAPDAANNPEATTAYTSSVKARVLTIPGAVYHISRNTVESGVQAESPVAVPPVTVAQSDSEEIGAVYVEAVADEAAEDVYTYVPSALQEPESKISQSAVSEVIRTDIAAVEAHYAAAYRADDAGVYTVPLEYNESEPVSDELHPVGIPYDPSHEEEEYTRFLAEQEQKHGSARKRKRVSLDDDTGHVYFPVDSIDRSVKLVESRMLYEIESMKAKHRMMGYTFTTDVLKKDRTERKIRRQINDRMYKLSRALKRERADSTRYYTAALDKYEGNVDKRMANGAMIESILGRLDYLLKERERVDESLMRLYGQNDDKVIATKEKKVAERAARAAYKSQLKAAKRVARMHAPEELKEKIFTLMNERITMIATIEKNEYLLSKKRYTGADKRNVKRQNKDIKRSLKHKEEDIRFFIKKAEKRDTAHGDGMRQLGWLLLTLIVIGALGAIYFLAKYYWGWF